MRTDREREETFEKNQRIGDDIKLWAHRVERSIELVMALIVIAAVILQALSLIPLLQELAASRTAEVYESILSQVLNIIIGVEFFRLLAAPDIKVVLEVMMFAMTRHMIVEHSTAAENLLTVIGIGIIAFLQQFLRGKLPSLMRRTSGRTGSGKRSGKPTSTAPDTSSEAHS